MICLARLLQKGLEVEKLVKLGAHVETLVKFMDAELPAGAAKDLAFIKAQELVWWANKSVADDEMKKKTEAANAPAKA